MRSYTESTSISVQQLPMKSVKDWARTLIRDGKAQELLLLMKLIPLLNQLKQESILFEFLDMDEHLMVELISEGNESAKKIEEINGLRDRQELWKALDESEGQFERSIKKQRSSNKPELNINVIAYQLGQVTAEYHGKFVAYLEITHATRSQIVSFKNLRHFTINAINRFSYYLEQVTEAIGITTIKETMKAMERAKSASQQPRSAEKKRQNQGRAHNPYQMAADPNASKILWKTTSAQKRK